MTRDFTTRFHRRSVPLQHRTDVLHRLTCLRGDAASHEIPGAVGSELTGEVEHLADPYRGERERGASRIGINVGSRDDGERANLGMVLLAGGDISCERRPRTNSE
jgi:hypothetical protein